MPFPTLPYLSFVTRRQAGFRRPRGYARRNPKILNKESRNAGSLLPQFLICKLARRPARLALTIAPLPSSSQIPFPRLKLGHCPTRRLLRAQLYLLSRKSYFPVPVFLIRNLPELRVLRGENRECFGEAAAATDAKRRPGFQTSTRAACAPNPGHPCYPRSVLRCRTRAGQMRFAN